MANNTLRGSCPAPFYDESFFAKTGGYQAGRFCAPLIPGVDSSPSCCLPCPATEWLYPDSFNGLSSAAAWLNVVGFIFLAFLLLSYALLPAHKTNKHYLNVCLIVSCMSLNLGFIVPLASRSDQCYDAVTSNDMYSDTACAFSGSFILLGGLSAAVWVCLRALSMFLQIVWGIEPGKKSFYTYQAIGWGIPAALVTAALVATGVSYRFGNACHINHEHSLVDFWGWLLAIAGITIIIQICTMVYCLKVYLTNLFASDDEDEEDDVPDLTPTSFNEKPGLSPASPTPTDREIVPPKVTAREIYAQVKTVLYVQWRILFLTVTMLVEIIFFSVVFVLLDTSTTAVRHEYDKLRAWTECLVISGGNKNQCLHLTHSWMVNYSAISGVLIMLSLIGISVFVLLFRTSIISGWRDWIAANITHRKTFASVGNPQIPQIRHLGVISPSESARSHDPLASGGFANSDPRPAPVPGRHGPYHHIGTGPGSPQNQSLSSPYTPTTPKLVDASDYYDVTAVRQQNRPHQDVVGGGNVSNGTGRYWHPNPNVQAAQREGIMRTLRLARARAATNAQSQSQTRYPYTSSAVPNATPHTYTSPEHPVAHELPPDHIVKDYSAH